MTEKTPAAMKKRQKEMEQILFEEGLSAPDLAVKMGLDRSTVKVYIKKLRAKLYIERYIKRGPIWTKIWRFGTGTDAIKPVDTPSKNAKQHRGHDDDIDLDNRPSVKVIVRRHPLDIALYGEYRRNA